MAISHQMFELAAHYIPGGVNSPVRAFNGVDGNPLFLQKGVGPYVVDADQHQYIDYVGSWGPLILGHAHPEVIKAVTASLQDGLSFGAPTVLEVQLAQKICELMPNLEQVRMVNSGTEAAMSAIRLARGFTQRNKIIKFAGCYHGHVDALLVEAGSGALTLSIPSSAGITPRNAEDTLIAEFNHLASVEHLFEQYGTEIAAIIVEPVAGNMNCILPHPDFLKGLRQLCDTYQSLLIFDEVITGFRVALGGAQAYFNIKPDITILGKIIGGGMPVGAFGGRKEIMQCLAPIGPVYQAGTLSGNPIAMTAGLATLQIIESTPNFYKKLTEITQQLVSGLIEQAEAYRIPLQAVAIGGMFGLFFTDEKVVDTYAKVQQCNLAHFKQFFHAMLKAGIYLAPSAYEIGFVSAAHGAEEVALTIRAAKDAFAKINF